MTKGMEREWSIVSKVAVRLNKMRTETRSLDWGQCDAPEGPSKSISMGLLGTRS